MPKLRIGSRGSNAKMERISSRSKRTWRLFSYYRSTLALLKWGFGEYYQCGYWAALENRGSRLFAAARGSNPLLSAAVRDPRTLGTLSGRNSLLTHLSSEGNLKLVLKRGPLPFLGGLTSRLSLLYDILPQVFHHA